MTCVLGMVVEREREIRNFKKVPYYKIVGTFQKGSGSFQADWKVTEKSKYNQSPRFKLLVYAGSSVWDKAENRAG